MSRVLLGVAMVVSLAVPGGLVTSWIASATSHSSSPSGYAPSSSSPAPSLTTPSSSGSIAATALTVRQHNRLVDEINALLKLHEKIVKSVKLSGPPDLTDAASVQVLGAQIASWESLYGGVDAAMDGMATSGSRFAAALAALLRDPANGAAFRQYTATANALRAAIALVP